MMVDSTLEEMGRHLSEAIRTLGDGQRELKGTETWHNSRSSIPRPLQGDGQDVASILQLVQNLMYLEEGEGEDKPIHSMIQNLDKQGHMALLGHSLAAYISVLDSERLRKLTRRILSDTTLWLCRLFRYESGSAYFHEDDREGLVKVCRLVINARYEEYVSEGYVVLSSAQPVIYLSASCRPGLGQHLCSQLGLPLSSLCTVPCNTVFGSQHQMDVALLDKLIKEDKEAGKVPLLLIANAGTPDAGHTDKLGRLKELCDQYTMWLHVEGVNLATLVLDQVSSTVMAATTSDSMTLTPGLWLGLPAVPAVTLYRHEDPALSLAAGLTSSQPLEKLRALPLWFSLQYLGHNGIVHKIEHATTLSQQLLQKLESLASIKTLVADDLSSPVVVFRFAEEVNTISTGERELLDTFNRWLGKQLAQLVPASGVDVVEMENEGTCVRFNPLMAAGVQETQYGDVEALMERLSELVPVLSSTLRLRQDFKVEANRHFPFLSYIEDLSWPGLGAFRYELQSEIMIESQREQELEKINCELLKKLQDLDTDLSFSLGPEFTTVKDCVFVGMATDDLNVLELVDTVATLAREIEDSGRLLENMTEVVRKGILEAEQQLQKASEEKIMEEGLLRQLPLVSSVVNWFSPFQSSVKGRTFNLAAGSLDSTEPTYLSKSQTHGPASPDTPTSSMKALTGPRLFRHSTAGSDCCGETDSIAPAKETTDKSCASPENTTSLPTSLPLLEKELPDAPQVAKNKILQSSESEEMQGEINIGPEKRRPESQKADDTGR
ncbi:pyridoxal-dependent decarboxylase domain-containing protein 1 [Lampris incognitus]|uniref:pyridoxal-dependent decarboxylase domain-containing protein 1 n=1 Tax=Lampris incognitus TaxID=2546036 RepID=UPI0024B62EC0|nr:pyridoxal-dependent decarboxylase domain-containing protein 1 [Lampris incognitus]